MITKILKKGKNSTISSLFVGIVVIMAMFMVVGCEKDEETIVSDSDSRSIYVENGILVFKDNSTFVKTLDMLNKMDEERRTAWEESLGFTSMLTLFYKINEAEDLNQMNFYKGVDPSLDRIELENKGLSYERSEIFNKYLQKGMISELIEPDGSVSFDLTVFNKGYSKVINEDGVVIVGDKKFEYSSEMCKMTYLDGKGESITFLYNTKENNNWSSYTTATSPALQIESGWAMATSTKRFKLQVIGNSSNTMTSMSSTYYVEAIGQEKKWGSWAIRNSYNPIYSIDGSWVFRWIKTYEAGPFVNVYELSDSDFSSPFSYILNGSNHCLMNLKPNGLWTLYDDLWYIHDGPDVTQKSFDGDFYGGQSGYHIYLN